MSAFQPKACVGNRPIADFTLESNLLVPNGGRMTLLSLAVALLSLAGQQVTADRPGCCGVDDRVIVVSADENVAIALGRRLKLDDGSTRFFTYAVYRHGLPETEWTTPAYQEGALDVRCDERTARVAFLRLHRGNGDPLVSVRIANNDAPFFPQTDPAVQRQFEVACSNDERVSYEHYGLFMEAYGLNDGRTPRVGPGPMVP